MDESPAASEDRNAFFTMTAAAGGRKRGPSSRRGKASPSPLLLLLIARSTHWLSAWCERRMAEVRRWRDARTAARQQPQRMHFEALEPRVLMSADLNPAVHAFVGAGVADVQHSTSTVHALAVNLTPVTDPDGTVATVVLTGPGTATLTPQGGAYGLSLTGTNATSTLTLTTTGGDGRISLASLSTDSALGDARLGSADLHGTAHFAGAVGSLTLGKLDGADLTFAGSGETSLKTGDIHDSLIHAGSVDLSLVADSLSASTAGASSVDAAGLKSLAVKGDSNADFKLSGIANGNALAGYVLGTVKVDGALAGLWSVHGRASAIQAGSTATGLQFNVNSTLVQLVTKGDMSGNVAVAGLQLLQVGGSARHLTLQVGADLGDDAALRGAGADADSFKAGTLARVRVTGDIVDSRIYVSIDPVDGVLGDGDDRQIGSVVQRVQEFSVGGTLQGSTSVIAPMFPTTVRIGGQTLSPGTVPGLGTTPADTVAPVVTARLRNDTGVSATDLLTQDAATVVQFADAGAVGGFQARLGSNAFSAVAPVRQADGTYLLSVAQLTTLNGGSLPDAGYSLDLFATDLAGNRSATVTVAFTLDTTAPGATAFGLDPASDSGSAGDNSTTASIVKLVGLAEAGAAISLRRNGSNAVEGTTTAANDGTFSFDGIALPTVGANGFTLILTDSAGNSRSNAYTFTRESGTAPGGDTVAPVVTAALAADTGRSATDGVTRDATITGAASDDVGVTQLLAALDATSTPVYTDITARLQQDGRYTVTPAQLATLAGGTLADGSHTLRLVAKDAAGNSSTPVDVGFTLDTAAPSGASFGLSQADAVTGTDDQTTAAVVQLRGTAEVGAIVSLASQNLSAQAGAGGVFQLPGVVLATGGNTVTLAVTDVAGNTQTVSRILTRQTSTGQADAVLTWNSVALQAIQRDNTDPPIATRILAIQSVAVYDTLAAIEGTPAFLVQRSVTGDVSAQAATAYAAYSVLYQLYPAQRDALDQALQTSLGAIPDGAAKTAGIALGRDIANTVIAIRANDGYLDFATEEGGTGLYEWRPTGPMFLVAQDPQWKDVTPFVLTSNDEFRAPPPPAIDSPEYAAAINLVESIGSATSTTRTADQTQQALFWQDGGGSYTPPGHWNAIASQVATAKGNSLSANARLMAELNVALADAAIACWDTKYTYLAWRPVTAIQNADIDGNAATTQDANWRSLLLNPPHPDYVSGHSTFSAAAAGVLAATFGDATSFSTTSPTLPGVTRSFSSFSQAADEAGLSRVYGGIHTPYANAAGRVIGEQVAAAVIARFDLKDDTQAPSVVVDATNAAVKANLTLTGQVLDNLSGVASAQWRLDNGALQSFSFDADGHFTLTTALKLDGSQDGDHVVTILARDAAGNLSAGYTRAFTLDTKAPTLALTGLAEGAAIDGASRLTGTAGGTGTAVTSLLYAFDGGTAKTLTYDPTQGTFDQALALGNLEVGDHTVTFTAIDAAGNTATLTRHVSLAAAAPFTVTKVAPATEITDVGVTYRPQVFFSRAVNPATLTSDTLYATGPDGSKLDMQILPATDGSFAWLLPNTPMPGSSTITLHVRGSAIRAAMDGAFLDADGDGAAGGELTYSFTTASTTSVLGAKLVGKVVDPGPDLDPMTFDDIGRGPDGVIHTADDVYKLPIAHALVYVIGRPDLSTYTDATGNFSFDSVPVGDVKLAIDGRTATNPPAGVFFPEMVLDLTLKPGVTNTAMSSMGTTQSQADNVGRPEVYLPRVQTASLQNVSDTATTTITMDAKSAPDITDAQRSEMTLAIAPGTAIGFDGKVMTGVKIGINTVPPEIVKDMLPPGVLEHTFDITIQAPGVDVFSVPQQITFPNVFNAAAGTKLNILSFDHTTGRLVINGTATVSADGKSVTSDPDSGILAPGWHGLTPPGGPSSPPCDPTATHDINVDPVAVTNGIKDYLFHDDNGEFTLSFGNAASKIDPSGDDCSTTNIRATPLIVKVTVEGPNVNDFLTGLASNTYSLEPGQQQNIKVSINDLLAGIKGIDKDRLYGAKIHVEAWKSTTPSTLLIDEKAYVYRYLDAADAKHDDGIVEMPDTANDGVGGVMRRRDLDLLTGPSTPTLKIDDTTNFSNVLFPNAFLFDPQTTQQDLTQPVRVLDPDGKQAGTLTIKGDGDKQKYYVNTVGFADELTALSTNAALTVAERALIDTDAKRADIVAKTVARIATLASAFAPGIELVSASAADVTKFPAFTTAAGETAYGESLVDHNGNGGVVNLIATRINYSPAEQDFRFSETLNENPGETIGIHLKNFFNATKPATADELINAVAKSMSHEMGHAIGLEHTSGGGKTVALPGAGNDVMAQGGDYAGTRTFAVTADAYRVAVGVDWTEAQAQNALDYFKAYIDAGGDFDAPENSPDPEHQSTTVFNGAVPWILSAPDGKFIGGALDLGDVLADGAGKQKVTRNFTVANIGDQPLAIASLALNGASPGLSLSSVAPGSVVQPGAELAFSLTWDPAASGPVTGRLALRSDGLTGDYLVDITGRAVSPTQELRLAVTDDNFGGVTVGNTGATHAGFGEIRNSGSLPLTVTSIVSSSADFRVVGAAAAVSAATPVVLAPGQTFAVDMAFKPGKVGLDAAKLRIASNDPNAPVTEWGLVGTGLPATGNSLSYGNDYVALRSLDPGDNTLLRASSDAAGNWSFFLPPEMSLQFSIFDPVSGLIANGFDTSAVSGASTHLNTPVFLASTANDSDFDGLPDDIEFAIGSNARSADTNKDGIDDFASIQQGINPLGNLGVPTGVLAATTLPGGAQAVAVAAPASDASQLTAYVATGSQGLSIVDVSKFTKPTVLGGLDLTGTSTDVAVDAARSIAAVAANDAGLHLVDVSDPSEPKLLQTVAFGAPVTAVQLRDGLAYVATGDSIAVVDLNTGEVRSTLDLGTAAITGIAIEGTELYTMDAAQTLRAISIAGNAPTVDGSLTVTGLSNGGGKLFVGNGVAYLSSEGAFQGGFETVDVRNPRAMTLVSGVDDIAIAGRAIALNGSGLGVSVGSPGGVFGTHDLDVLDTRSSADTGKLVTRYALPQAPLGLALANGLAFVADGSGGLQIVNFVGFDSAGVPPTVSITVDGVDVDPSKTGIQILEGRPVQVKPVVSDDVQVRNVELLVNGKVVSNDAAFPFELFAQAPTIAAGGNKLTLQVRATDTGGNSTLSAPVVLDVVPDTFPPVLKSSSVDDGARRFFVRSIDFGFDEPLDTTRLTTSAVQLVRAGADGNFGTADDVTIPVTLDFRASGQSVSVLPGSYLAPGDYRLTIAGSAVSDLAGNKLAAAIVRSFSIRPASDVRATTGVPDIPTAPSANPGQQIGIAVPFDPATGRAQFATIDANGTTSTVVVAASRWDNAKGLAYFNVPANAVTGDVVVYGLVGTVRTDFADGTFPLQIVPLVADIQVQSVAADGTSAVVVISGRGFVEGNNSEYRFGTDANKLVVVDAGATTGPDVQPVYDYTLNQYANGQVTLTVPLTDGVFGAISVKTAGGVSAAYSVSLGSVNSVALSGTPKDAGEASANAGQSVTLVGSGLSTATDVLLRWSDINGAAQMTRLSPSAAAADGKSATLAIPAYANGAYGLQVFGSATQPLLQIVPKISRTDQQDRLVLFGGGFVEGASSYTLAGASVADTAADAGHIDVYYDDTDQNRSVYLDRTALPAHGLGTVSVTTAGGTSAAVALNDIEVSAGGTALGDVAIDPRTGALWTSDAVNPGHLLRIDATSGAVLQTIAMTDAFGTPYAVNYAGLQILGTAASLGGASVPAGSILVFNGYPSPDRVVAVNPASGAVLASVTLGANYDLTSGVLDPTTGHLFVTESNGAGNRLLELDATSGALINAVTLPLNATGWSGLAIDPSGASLWIGATSSANQIVQISRSGSELRRIDLATQGVNQNEISGLAFAADGSLFVASTQGVVYKVDTRYDAAVQPATLTQVVGVATDGTPTSAAVASANIGQAITLVGTHFGANTQVLFDTRDASGTLGTTSVTPQAISADGTRLQVLVPDLATTANVRVVNIAATNLGYGSNNDGIYRRITTSFVAGSSSASLRFADGGLEGLGNESWGLDNVKVTRGGTTVFSDDFEAGAKAAWSDATTDASDAGNFSRYSGRFSNASQTLALSGLTAGQTYSLSFDLYVIDSWDGARSDAGPDLIQVTADGTQIFKETFGNYGDPHVVQTYGASAGVRLQIVPTLTGLAGGRPGSDSAYNLSGSGFMEGASTVTIGGVAFSGSAGNGLDVSGSRNDTFSVVTPRTLDGAIKVTTEGGSVQIAGPTYAAQPLVNFTAIGAAATAGSVADASKASANTGQVITLSGQGLTDQTLVQFQGIDDSGALGTITRTGSAGNGGTTLQIEVPALARSGLVSVLGSNVSLPLQVVPTLQAVGGTVAAGNTLVLQGTGLVASELTVQIDGVGVGSFNVRTLIDGSTTSSSLDQQLMTLTVPAGVGNGVITVSTNGGGSTLRSKLVGVTAGSNLANGADAGDTLAAAAPLTVPADQRLTVAGVTGNGAQTSKDVDLYRLQLNAGDVLSLDMSATATYSHLRLFDATGKELATQYLVPNSTAVMRTPVSATGTYYIGVSDYYNNAYDPRVAGSGSNATFPGNYVLGIERLSAGNRHLASISAPVISGTAAQAGVAAANVTQTITLHGSGFAAAEPVLFSALDGNGRLFEQQVAPSSVAGDGTSLTVVVPVDATTGTVRLARDTTGILLQIVPTLGDVAASVNGVYHGGALTLRGSGFAEGASSVLFGAQVLADASRSTGLDVYGGYVNGDSTQPNGEGTALNLTVPPGVPSGPIQVRTVGGTSAAFGVAVTGITASATSGTPRTGGQASAVPGQTIKLQGTGLDTSTDVVFETVDGTGHKSEVIVHPSTVNASGTEIQLVVPSNAITGVLRVVGDTQASSLALQIVPVVTDIQVESVAGDGSTAQVLLSGYGFVEGHDSEYRFGSQTVLDAGAVTGPDVFDRYDASGYVGNGYVRVTVPLTGGTFGAISVKTAGGTSASFTTTLASVNSVALSGTPKEGGEASANAGQSVTLVGSGLSTATDVLLRWSDINGAAQMTRLSPSAAAADGKSATLAIPAYANGAYGLQVFGSATQPLLQIVPKISRTDQQDRLVLFGGGFVEGASSYTLAGASVADTAADAGHIDVYYDDTDQNRSVYLDRTALPAHGLGTVSVTTAGGTSAAVALNDIEVSAGGTALGDVAIDPRTGALWTSDAVNPGHLLRIDATSGAVLQTIAMTDAFGTPYAVNYAGLQILGTAASLGGASVPAGSILVFNGYPNADRVVAVNPASGAVLASVTLGANYDLTSGVLDPTTGHLFVTESNGAGNRLLELDATSGALINAVTLPLNATGWSGLAIDPSGASLWIGATSSANQIVQISRSGSELRRIDLATQGVNQNEISGLAFAADGSLFVASTQGVVYKVDTRYDAAVQPATLTQVVGVATDGTPTSAAVASANIGQAITLVGTHFGANTQVLFDTRDASGTLGTTSVTPQAISADGTRLQVLVPDLATTANVRVVNIAATNLGYGSNNDGIYRRITTSFVAGSSSASLRFADGGLEGLGNESWGLDNVKVTRGGTTVFSDDFEAGAKAAWSDATTDASDAGNFSRYSGRFSNASQTLALSGLTAGQTYSLSFDLYVIDSWDGARSDAGPDLIQVTADGTQIFKETFGNYGDPHVVQTYGASAGVRLQIVPTLTGLAGGRPGSDSAYNLSGSGFMEGASTVTIGGVAFSGSAGNGLDVSGSRNDTFSVVTPRTLDGAIKVTTEGGSVQIAGPTYAAQPLVNFTAIGAAATAGSVADASKASANTGQVITLSGQGLTDQTLVQFQGIDDSGALGTITRTGSAGNGGTTLQIEVPALARSGLVSVLGSNVSLPLQVVPTLQAVGGTVAAGNTLVLQGTGLVASELTVQIDGVGVGSFNVRTLIDGSTTSSSLDQQLMTLTVPAGVGNGVITVSTNGGGSTLRSKLVGVTAGSNLANGADAGDTLAAAAPLTVPADQRLTVAGVTGNGAQTSKDVDLYRLQLNAGDVLSLDMSATATYSHLRLFDATGKELATQYLVPNSTAVMRTPVSATGTYYIGVSDYYNNAYDPRVAGSGSNATFPGNYVLGIERLSAGNRHLASISAPVISGTAAQAGVAAANVTQTITLHGSGFAAAEPVLFSALDGNGRLFEQQVAPSSVAGDGTSLTVVVPVDATTGTVRLARDTTGILLQIVPTLGDVAASVNGVYHGGALTLRGSGFAEGASSVLFGAQVLADASRSTGLDVYGGYVNGDSTQPNGEGTALNLTVPPGVPSGPIQVRTVGGTSAAFGVAVTGITASATSGTPRTGGQASAVPGQTIKLQGTGLDTSTDVVFETVDGTGHKSEVIVHPSTVNASGTEIQLVVPSNAITGVLRVVGDTQASSLALQIVPVVTDIQVESVAGDGSTAQVLLSGYGFVEGHDSEYRFGSQTVLDAGAVTGPDVFDRYDASGYVGNGYVRVTVPLTGGTFGAISVKTAGGTSASFTTTLASVNSVALSGTPKEGGEASANAGQSVTLVGSGLSTATDVLLRWSDINGAAQMTRLSPSAAAADGKSATLAIPAYANGAYGLQVFGSATQPLLQIVPKISRTDQQDRLVLFGGGFVEGASSYTLAGASVADTAADAGHIDVYYDDTDQNRSVYLDRTALPAHGLGTVSVTTAGGTSAAVALNDIEVSAGGTALGDVAIDPRTGALWTSDAVNPGHLLRIDATSGAVLQTIAMTDAFGTPYAVNYAGLQILGTAASLGGASVPAGSILVFNGYPNADRVVAVNPASGAVLASVTLGANYDLTSGVLDPTTGHLFVTESNGAGNRLLELDATSGALINAVTLPLNATGWSGLAIDPSGASLWIGATSSANQIVQISRSGSELRRIDLAAQGVNQNEISGLAFAADGSLFVASTQGVVYKVSVA